LKMYVTSRILQFRREHRDLFHQGEYIPLRVTGERADHVIAFARHLHDEWCVVAVPRLCVSLTRSGTPPLGEKVWQDTQIELPADCPTQATDVFTQKELSIKLAADLFDSLPVAVLRLLKNSRTEHEFRMDF